VATLEPPPAELADARNAAHELVRAGRFVDSGPLREAAPDAMGVLVLTVDLPVYVSLFLGTHCFATQRVESGAKDAMFGVERERLSADECSVRARFIRADTGEPLKGEVCISSRHSELMDLMVKDGVWQSRLAPGPYRISFWSRECALSPRDVTLAPGEQ